MLTNQLMKKVICFIVIAWLMSGASSTDASPPACGRNDVSMHLESDAVVEAIVIKSRRWSKGAVTHYLVAKYKVLDVFKGDVSKDDILIVTDTCLDKPVPNERLGYPVVEDYCRGLIGLSLTGVDSRDGKPVMKSGSKPSWILFLRKDIRKGAPQLTWVEVSRTSYYGGCRRTRDDIPAEQIEGFDHLFKKLKVHRR
jgi:hypothetical protein